MKILIIEDNLLIAKTLVRNLKNYYVVEHVSNGMDGLAFAMNDSYDTILLDLNLPDINGEEVCKQLRSGGYELPIIVVSGRDAVKDRIELLNMGADDYLIKPFNLDELRARIDVALRHTPNKALNGILSVDKLELNPANRTVMHYGKMIDLRRKEFDLLAYFMYNHGQTLTRTMIIEHVWDKNENLWANVIDVHIKHLRDKVDRPFCTNLILTVHGLGYKIQSEIKDMV